MAKLDGVVRIIVSRGDAVSALVFEVPKTIQEPVLLVMTCQGEDRFEYKGLRLY